MCYQGLVVQYRQERCRWGGISGSVLKFPVHFTLHFLHDWEDKRHDQKAAQTPKRVKFTNLIGGSILRRYNWVNNKHLYYLPGTVFPGIYSQQDKPDKNLEL